MLKYALEHREAINRITSRQEGGLRRFKLSKSEWTLLEQLCHVLKVRRECGGSSDIMGRFSLQLFYHPQVLKDGTLFFSTAALNLAAVIPGMDIIDKEFSSYIRDRDLTPAIHAAVSLAKQTLNKYYSLSDSSEVSHIAMILHPHHKLTYFKNAHWEKDWIKTAESLLHEEFNRSYTSVEHTSDSVDSDAEIVEKPAMGKTTNLFAQLDVFAPPKSSDLHSEIDRYLAMDVEKAEDVLKWWHDRHVVYPCLSRMALDYLSIPPTSIDVEWLFSHGWLVLSHVRSCLSVNTTRALLCLGAWSLLNLIKTEDVKQISALPDVKGSEEDMEDAWNDVLMAVAQ